MSPGDPLLSHRILSVFAFAILVAAPAVAEPVCGTETHIRYGETRAYFQDVWAGCTPTGECQLSASKIDKTQAVNISHEARFTLQAGTPLLGLKLMSVTDAVAIDKPMQLVYGKDSANLTGAVETRGNVVNEYHVKDPAQADTIARAAIAKTNVARWIFTTESGETKTVELPLRGAAKALDWITCMAKPAH